MLYTKSPLMRFTTQRKGHPAYLPSPSRVFKNDASVQKLMDGSQPSLINQSTKPSQIRQDSIIDRPLNNQSMNDITESPFELPVVDSVLDIHERKKIAERSR